ncbi:MAG: endonuclease [Candidatus Sumerlaeaceae bacterium]|nr:endonuclease [Candidatus Sumerlaeaceae bacterium]
MLLRPGHRAALSVRIRILLVIWSLGIATLATAAPPPGYYDSAEGLSGPALRTALNNIIKNHTVIPYSSTGFDTKDALDIIEEDPNNTANVLLHYKPVSVPKSSFPTLWNREHTWPQSLGADVSPKSSDLHALFAEDPSLNSSRGNSPYNYVPSPTNTAFGNRWTGSQFEVRDAQKGDCARAIFYMATRYLDFTIVDHASPGYKQMGVLSALLAWHAADPPDAAEMARNDRVYAIQNNRNPFIDRPEFVNLIFAPVSNGNTLTVGSTNRAGATVAAGAVDYPVLSLHLTANANEWDLQSIGISNIGTLGDSAITAVKLYRDNDNSGSVTGGDTLLDTRTFTSGSATFTCANPSRITTATANFLITASVSAMAPNGQTLRIRVNANSIIHSPTGGADIDPTFAAIDSAAATVSGGVSNGDTLSVSFTNRAGTSVTAGTVNYPLLSITAAANSNEWDLASVAVSNAGTASDSRITDLRLYRDLDNSGSVTGGDTLLDTRTFAGGATTFTLASPLRMTSAPVHLLITAHLSGIAVNGTTLRVQVNANGLASAPSGGADINPTFSAFQSNAAVVIGGVTDGDTLSLSFINRAPASANAGTTGVPLLTIEMAASANEWDLAAIHLARLGTVSDSGIAAIRLYEDENADGLVDANDLLLDSRTFSSGTAQFQFNGDALRITPTTQTLLIAADIAAGAQNGQTLGVRIQANGITSANSGGSDINPSFPATDSGLLTVNVAGGPNSLVISEVVEGTQNNYKWVEILNRGSVPVQLNDPSNQIVLRRYTNGSVSVSGSVNLTGTIPPGGRFVVANNQADYRAVHGPTADASQYSGVVQHNGDDSYDLFNAGTSTIIDGFAKDWCTGTDPGDPASDGVLFRVLTALPNNGNFGQTTKPTSGTTTLNGYWYFAGFTAGNGGAAVLTTPFAGGGGGGVEVPVAVSRFRLD